MISYVSSFAYGNLENFINTVRRRAGRAALAAVTGTVLLATGPVGCSSVRQLGTADQVSRAFAQLGEGGSLNGELSLDASADQILAFDRAAHTDEPLSRTEAGGLAGLTLGYSFHADRPLKELDFARQGKDGTVGDELTTAPGLDYAYRLTGKDGRSYAETRKVGGTVFLKADTEGLARLFGADMTEYHDVVDGVPGDLGLARAVLADKWVAFDAKGLGALGGGQGAPGHRGLPAPAPSLGAGAPRDAGQVLKEVLKRELDFEDWGSQDGVRHLVVSAPLRALVNDLLASFKPFTKDLPAGSRLLDRLPADVPSHRAGLDVFVKDGAVSSLGFDLAQLLDDSAADAHLRLKLSFAQDGPAPQAPSGAATFTAADLLDVFDALTAGADPDLAGLPGGHGRSGGSGTTRPSPAAPLTEDQIRELVADGLSRETILMFNRSGFDFDDLRKFAEGRRAAAGSPARSAT
ncbi:hypothetical protein ACFC1R_14645 [Kitasatospora sp. NPDC056138]|uniref:hypothetical protein n=1 Tax=Kitasatospora sp. NPDC056138 TaxID=3345724 RepID=UPI0035DDAD2C